MTAMTAKGNSYSLRGLLGNDETALHGGCFVTVWRGCRAWLPIALRQQPWSARGDFTGMLDALAVRLRAEAAEASHQGGTELTARLEALRRVEHARSAAQGNVNPQLALSALASDLERIL